MSRHRRPSRAREIVGIGLVMTASGAAGFLGSVIVVWNWVV